MANKAALSYLDAIDKQTTPIPPITPLPRIRANIVLLNLIVCVKSDVNKMLPPKVGTDERHKSVPIIDGLFTFERDLLAIYTPAVQNADNIGYT